MMLDALAYLGFLLCHKLAVYREGVKLGVPRWLLVKHDLSKLGGDEFWGYLRWYYAGPHPANSWQHLGFKRAWSHHWQTNPHHWEHWAKREVGGQIYPIQPRPMPDVYVREMVADWHGANAARRSRWATWRQTSAGEAMDTLTFYAERGPTMALHPETRRAVEGLLGVPDDSRLQS